MVLNNGADMNGKIRLLIVDDYPVVLSGLVSMFQTHEDIDLVGVADNGKKAVDLALTLKPHVVLMNVSMPEMDGIEASQLIKKGAPEVHILIFSGLSGYDQVTSAINAGATGYILKDASEIDLLQAIRQVASGEAYLHPSIVRHVLKQIQDPVEQEGLIKKLTERELDVLKYMAQGYSNQEIAKLMVVSMGTIHSHVSHILAKLEVSSRTQAVIYAMRAGVVPEN
jgi:DNA-binding NarL/FixJ family response regulator